MELVHCCYLLPVYRLKENNLAIENLVIGHVFLVRLWKSDSSVLIWVALKKAVEDSNVFVYHFQKLSLEAEG